MFKLYPSEELIIETESNPKFGEHKKSKYLLVVGVVLAIVAAFYYYASSQDFILQLVFWFSLIASIISFTAYFYKMSQANKLKGQKKYYLTSRRVVETDNENNITREMLLAKIKRVIVDPLSKNSGDVVINPRDLSAEEAYKQNLKGVKKQKYAKESFIIENIADADGFAKKLKIK